MKNKISRNCFFCKQIFFVYRSKIKQGRGIFCSKKCKNSFQKDKPTWNKGKHLSIEHRNKIGEVRKKNPINYWCGRKRPEAYLWLMQAQREQGTIPNWKGGISFQPDYLKKQHKKYFLNNKERVYSKNRQRFYLKKNIQIEGTHTQEEWDNLKRKYNFTCLSCYKTEPIIKLTRDHIIPLTKNGTDKINNLQPLCLRCNISKFTRIIDFREGVFNF